MRKAIRRRSRRRVFPAPFDALNRLTEEKEIDGDETVFDERCVWDGSNLLEVLDGSNNVTERDLERRGGGPGVGDGNGRRRQSGRELAATGRAAVGARRGAGGDGRLSVVSAAAVDHVIYDAYGNQPVPQSATDPQLQTRVGFRGMMNDPLAGFDSTAGMTAVSRRLRRSGFTTPSRRASTTRCRRPTLPAHGLRKRRGEPLRVFQRRPHRERLRHGQPTDELGQRSGGSKRRWNAGVCGRDVCGVGIRGDLRIHRRVSGAC